jgi:hypothetical protein
MSDNPVEGTGISTDQAAAAIGSILNPQGQAEAEPAPVEDNPVAAQEPEAPAEGRVRDEGGRFVAKEPDAPAEEAEPDADPEGEPETDPEDELAEPEDAAPEDDELEELPDTLEGLAEAMEIDAKDLRDALKAKVKVNGEEMEVSLAEALDGYQRLEDYREKTAGVAEDRKAFEAEREAVTAERKHYADQLGPFIQQFGQRLAQDDAKLNDMLNPDSVSYDPEGYVREKARLDVEKQQLDNARQEHDRIQQQQQNEAHQTFLADVAEHEKALIEAVPDWGKDPEMAKKDLADIRAYAVSQGAPKELVDQEFRSYTLLLARKAMLYDQAQKKTPATLKKVRKLPKVMKSGAKKEKVDPKARQHRVNMDRLRKSGSVKDAAAIFREIM